jgi:hypothetical protein
MSPIRKSLGAAFIGLVFTCPVCTLEAQTEAAQLPVPLVTALMAGNRYSSSATGRYFVGALPPGWPADLVPPPPASVVGGMTSGTQLIAVFSDTTRRFLARYLKRLADAGWTEPTMERGTGFQSNGGGSYGFFCRDSARIAAIAAPGATSGAFVHVTYQRVDVSSCVKRYTPMRVSALDLPTLTPPPDVWPTTSGGGGGESEQSSHTHLVGAGLTPTAIAAHYAALLVAAGWTVDAPATADAIAAQAVRAHDKDGKLWSGSLIVVTAGSGRDVSLSMRRTATP